MRHNLSTVLHLLTGHCMTFRILHNYNRDQQGGHRCCDRQSIALLPKYCVAFHRALRDAQIFGKHAPVFRATLAAW